MNRVEANEKLIRHFYKEALKNQRGTFEEMVTWHLGAINSILSDISVSLAVIADNMSSEDMSRRERSGEEWTKQ